MRIIPCELTGTLGDRAGYPACRPVAESHLGTFHTTRRRLRRVIVQRVSRARDAATDRCHACAISST